MGGLIKTWSPDMPLVDQEASSGQPHLTTKTEGDKCSVEYVNSPTYKKAKAVKLTVQPPESKYKRTRAVTRPLFFKGDANKAVCDGVPIWAGLLLYIPKEWKDSWRAMIFEDHHLERRKVDGKTGSHNPFTLYIKDGHYEAVHHYKKGYAVAKKENLGSIEPDKGKFVSWILHVYASKNNGYVHLYKDTKRVFSYEGETYWGYVPLYIEHGLYNNDVHEKRYVIHGSYVLANDESKQKGFTVDEVHKALVS